MAWVVDTSVVLDLIIGDPAFEPASAACLQAHLNDGLIVCPVTFVELGPAFGGDEVATDRFLRNLRIGTAEHWLPQDTVQAHQLWHSYQLQRRQVAVRKRPLADVLIAGFASRFQGVITRNAADFRSVAPGLRVVEP